MGCGRSSLFGLTTDEKLDCAVHVEKKLQKTLNALGVPVADVQEMYVFSPVASYPHCTTPPPPLSKATRI